MNTNGSNDQERPEGFTASYRLSLLVMIAFIAVSIIVPLPTSVLGSVSNGAHNVWTVLYPQGWQFFTKDPDDPEGTVYAVKNRAIEPISAFPNSRPDNAFGFGRSQRAQGPELANITKNVESNDWIDCESLEGDCLLAAAEKTPSSAISNTSKTPTICNDVIVAMTEQVPWGYRDRYDGWRVDKKAAHVSVSCDA